MSAKLMVLQPTRLPPQLLNDEAAKLDFCRRVESPSLEKEKLPRTKEQGVPRLGRIDCGQRVEELLSHVRATMDRLVLETAAINSLMAQVFAAKASGMSFLPSS